jgi:hypothetical protein
MCKTMCLKVKMTGRAFGILGFCGALLMGVTFALSFAYPLAVARVLREIVRIEIERRLDKPLGVLSDARIEELARAQLQQTVERITQISNPDPVSHTSTARSFDCQVEPLACEAQVRISAYREQAGTEQLDSLARARSLLLASIEAGYASVSTRLLRELRIVTASSAVTLVVAGLLGVPRHGSRKTVACSVLIGSAVLMASLYVFGQDWAHTVIYGDYLDIAYPWLLLITALCSLDLLANRARVLLGILRGGLEWIQSAIPV